MANKNIIICGMGFGDEGKGSFVDYITYRYGLSSFVRYNGGSHAGHSVVTPKNIRHTFSQIGSGILARGYGNTYLTKNMVINLGNIEREKQVLLDETRREPILQCRIIIDEGCMVVTPYHIIINRMQELALGKESRGTVGSGVSTVKQFSEMAITVRDIYGAAIEKLNFESEEEYEKKGSKRIRAMYLDSRLEALKNYAVNFYADNKEKILEGIEFLNNDGTAAYAIDSYIYYTEKWLERPVSEVRKELIDELLSVSEVAYTEFLEDSIYQDSVYEGSQGLLIDSVYGTKPNTTYLDTTIQNAVRILEGKGLEYKKIGIIKAFYTRHGKGVFPTESNSLGEELKEENEEVTCWNGAMRYGWFDAVLFNYANEINNVDEVYLSSLDRLNNLPTIKICNEYMYLRKIDDEFDTVFDYYEDRIGRIIITRIKPEGVKNSSKDLTYYLNNCMPLFIEMNGWMENVTPVLNTAILPKKMIAYINKLEELINVPITVISLGPTKYDKVVLKGE